MKSQPWIAIVSVLLSSIAACNYTFGDCWYRGQGDGSGDVGSGVVNPTGPGGLGESPPPGGSVPASECNLPEQNSGKGSSGNSSSGGGDTSPDTQALYDALAQVDPEERAVGEDAAVYAAVECTDFVQSHAPAGADDAAIEQLFQQCQASAIADAQTWMQTVDPSSLPAGPVEPNPMCVKPPYSCPGVEYCPLGDGALCVITNCGTGKCPYCPFNFGNIYYTGHCTYACLQGDKFWGGGVRLITRWGTSEFFCFPFPKK